MKRPEQSGPQDPASHHPGAHPALSYRRIIGRQGGRPVSRRQLGGQGGAFVGFAMLILIAVVFGIMMRDGQVADNLGADLRHWSGRP